MVKCTFCRCLLKGRTATRMWSSLRTSPPPYPLRTSVSRATRRVRPRGPAEEGRGTGVRGRSRGRGEEAAEGRIRLGGRLPPPKASTSCTSPPMAATTTTRHSEPGPVATQGRPTRSRLPPRRTRKIQPTSSTKSPRTPPTNRRRDSRPRTARRPPESQTAARTNGAGEGPIGPASPSRDPNSRANGTRGTPGERTNGTRRAGGILTGRGGARGAGRAGPAGDPVGAPPTTRWWRETLGERRCYDEGPREGQRLTVCAPPHSPHTVESPAPELPLVVVNSHLPLHCFRTPPPWFAHSSTLADGRWCLLCDKVTQNNQ